MNFIANLRRNAARRRMYAGLMQLDDRLLRDIGIDRDDLRARRLDIRFADIMGANVRS